MKPSHIEGFYKSLQNSRKNYGQVRIKIIYEHNDKFFDKFSICNHEVSGREKILIAYINAGCSPHDHVKRILTNFRVYNFETKPVPWLIFNHFLFNNDYF